MIRAANAARSNGDWLTAAAAYDEALNAEPGLSHIWLQLGHALKECGRLDDATRAYGRAASIGSEGAEPHLHLGKVAKQAGNLPEAARHYFDALRDEPRNLAAATELMRCVNFDEPEGATMIAAFVSALTIEPPRPRSHLRGDHETPRIFLDITDLLTYFSHARLPTGIQRVQIALVSAMLHEDTTHIYACCYSESRSGWITLESGQFLALAGAALASDDRSDATWRQSVIELMLGVATDPAIPFEDGDTLITVGTSWSERNYFLHLRASQSKARLFYIAMVYDLIPTFAPRWFPNSVVDDYLQWLTAVADHADGYIAISHATRKDLRSRSGSTAPVAVLPLDADFRGAAGSEVPAAYLRNHGLRAGGFVLMVSTIEPRKNHIGALAAWLELIDAIGEAAVPRLVCVGGRGWMNDHVHAAMAAHPVLRRKVLFLHGVPDAELDLLYRSCLFTLYPSFYEGWGLPVTESLCYGKIPVISETSALPEAGGRFAVYFDPETPGSLCSALTWLLTHPNERVQLEHEIKTGFVPRTWAELGQSLLRQVQAMPMQARHSTPLPLTPISHTI